MEKPIKKKEILQTINNKKKVFTEDSFLRSKSTSSYWPNQYEAALLNSKTFCCGDEKLSYALVRSHHPFSRSSVTSRSSFITPYD